MNHECLVPDPETVWVVLGTSISKSSTIGAQAPTLGGQAGVPCADRDVQLSGLALDKEILNNMQQGI
jgi:hypothetical protein